MNYMIHKQLQKLKENWLLITLFLVALIFFSGINPVSSGFSKIGSTVDYAMAEPSNVDVPRPSSSRMTKECLVANLRMVDVSASSTKKVD